MLQCLRVLLTLTLVSVKSEYGTEMGVLLPITYYFFAVSDWAYLEAGHKNKNTLPTMLSKKLMGETKSLKVIIGMHLANNQKCCFENEKEKK